jgi:hypothetical protein
MGISASSHLPWCHHQSRASFTRSPRSSSQFPIHPKKPGLRTIKASETSGLVLISTRSVLMNILCALRLPATPPPRLAPLATHPTRLGRFSLRLRETPPQIPRSAPPHRRRHRPLLGVCFLRGVPEDVVVEIGEGEKGGCFPQRWVPAAKLPDIRSRPAFYSTVL